MIEVGPVAVCGCEGNVPHSTHSGFCADWTLVHAEQTPDAYMQTHHRSEIIAVMKCLKKCIHEVLMC